MVTSSLDFEVAGFLVRAQAGQLQSDLSFHLPHIDLSGKARDPRMMTAGLWVGTVRSIAPGGVFPDTWKSLRDLAVIVGTPLPLPSLSGAQTEFLAARVILEAAALFHLRKMGVIS